MVGSQQYEKRASSWTRGLRSMVSTLDAPDEKHQAVSLSADGTLWAATSLGSGSGRIGRYDASRQSFDSVAPVAAIDIAAASPSECWALTGSLREPGELVLTRDGDTTLPCGNPFEAGTDLLATVHAHGLAHLVASSFLGVNATYDLHQQVWTALPPVPHEWHRDPGIVVGAAEDVFVVTDHGVLRFADGVWSTDLEGGVRWERTWLVRTAAGEPALVGQSATDPNETVVFRRRGPGVWSGEHSWTANWPNKPSGSAAGIVWRDHDTIRYFEKGIADQAPEPWPAMTAEEVAVYDHISTALGVEIDGGIRTQYANDFADARAFLADLHRQERPGWADPDAWLVVYTQLDTELNSLAHVLAMFERLELTTIELRDLNSAALDHASELVGLQAPEQTKKVELPVAMVFNEILLVAAKRIPPPGDSIAKMVIAGINHAIAQRTGCAEGDPEAKIEVMIAALIDELRALYAESLATNGEMSHALRTDWGRLRDAGSEIRSGRWFWDSNDQQMYLATASETWQKHFLQTLTLVKWHVLKFRYFDSLQGRTPKPQAPGYASHWDVTFYPSEMVTMGWVWVFTTQTSSTKHHELGPFPHEQPAGSSPLLEFIYATFGVTKRSLLDGSGKFGLQTVDVDTAKLATETVEPLGLPEAGFLAPDPAAAQSKA